MIMVLRNSSSLVCLLSPCQYTNTNRNGVFKIGLNLLRRREKNLYRFKRIFIFGLIFGRFSVIEWIGVSLLSSPLPGTIPNSQYGHYQIIYGLPYFTWLVLLFLRRIFIFFLSLLYFRLVIK